MGRGRPKGRPNKDTNITNRQHRIKFLETQKVFIRTFGVDTDKYISYLRAIQKEEIPYKIERLQLFEKTVRSCVFIEQSDIDKYNKKYPYRKGCLDFPVKIDVQNKKNREIYAKRRRR